MEELLKEHHRAGYHWARQCCDFDDDRASEVLQMVYLKILEGKAKFRGESDVKTWFFSVIRFTAYEWRRQQRPYLSLDVCAEQPAAEAEEESPLFHEEMLLALAPRQREVILLVFYHHLTLEKAAEIMGISLGSASTHYDRAKKKLKTLIQQRKYSRDGC